MTKRITTLTDVSIIRILRMAVLSSLVMTAAIFAAGQALRGRNHNSSFRFARPRGNSLT